MILTDREIRLSLQYGLIKITPSPDQESYSSTTVDLTLGATVREWSSAAGIQIRPGAKGYKYKSLIPFQRSFPTTGYVLKPKEFVLAWTKEKVELPTSAKIAARIEGKSSLARLGIGIHVTAPTIHSGFEGEIQLEMFNFGPHDVILDEGTRICQLIFEHTAGFPEAGYSGMFAGQTSQT